MPVAFIGHGSPMNALADHDFTRALEGLGRELPRPRGVLCVSAHFMTEGTWVTGMREPRTIHDFGGFPKQLFEVQYPAPGSPELAERVRSLTGVRPTQEWGLDHGVWGVLKFVYPQADIPVVVLSLAMNEGPQYHFELGTKLQALRDEGILILGSGNIVHNLRKVQWKDDAPVPAWAEEFDSWVASRLEAKDYTALVASAKDTEAGRLSVPTWDHWCPLLTVLGASSRDDRLGWIFEGVQNASISMRSFLLI